MRELAKKKTVENCQKLLDFQRRLRNLGVTSFFERCKNVERVQKINENRKIWNEQLVKILKN